MRGIESYNTPDRLHVVKLHYSADEARDPTTKEGQDWVAHESLGYPGGLAGTQWRREMEIDFTVSGAHLVFPDWREREKFCVIDPIEVPQHWVIHFGYDYGYREPCAGVFVAYNGRLEAYIVDVIYKNLLTIGDQAKLIKRSPYWSRVRSKYGDPSIWARNQHIGDRVLSTGDLLSQEGIRLRKGRKETGVDTSFRDLLLHTYWRNPEKPRLKIFSTCRPLIKELRGLKFKDYVSSHIAERQDMLEQICSKKTHAWDAMKYIMLAHPIAEPDDVHPPEGSMAALKKQIKQMRRRSSYVLQ